jgi:hypothetical protein
MATPISTQEFLQAKIEWNAQVPRSMESTNQARDLDGTNTSMEQAAAGTAACAAVEEEHLPGARARRVEDEPSRLHGSMQERSKLGDSLP